MGLKVRSYWEHVEDVFGNTLRTKKIPTPSPSPPKEKKNIGKPLSHYNEI
jgi:hypothetical protein